MNPQRPPPSVSERWEELLADAASMAEEYEDEGWETLVITAGDVTPITAGPFGLDVLAPGSEYEALEDLVDDVTFETSHVYRTDEGGARFFIIVVEGHRDDDVRAQSETDDDPDGEPNQESAGDVAVFVPAYLDVSQSEDLEAVARANEAMYTHVRPLSDDSRVTFSHDDPELFF